MTHRPYDPDATEVTMIPGYAFPPTSVDDPHWHQRQAHGRRLPRQDQFAGPEVLVQSIDAGRSTLEVVLTTVKDMLVIITCVAILITLTWGYLTLQDIGDALKGAGFGG